MGSQYARRPSLGSMELLLEFKVRCLTKYEWPAELCAYGSDM